MSGDNSLSPLVARRRLSYLATFENKIHSLRRGLEKVRRASEDISYSGRLPTDDLERVARSLVGAGLVYGLGEVTDWANSFLEKISTVRKNESIPGDEDFEWLASRISALQKIRDIAIEEARKVAPSMAPRPVQADDPSVGGAPDSSGSGEAETGVENAETGDDPDAAPVQPGSHKRRFPSQPALSALARSNVQNTAVVVSSASAIRKKVAFTLTHAGVQVGEIIPNENAIEVLRAELPELVLVDMDDPAPGGRDLIEALARDPLTDFIPVIKIVSAEEPAGQNTIAKPIDGEQLASLTRSIMAPASDGGPLLGGRKDVSLSELMEMIGSEIKRGVIESAAGSEVDARFNLRDEASVVAVVWTLIAHLRRVVADSSGGKIRFIPTARDQVGIMSLPGGERAFDPLMREVVDEGDLAGLKDLHVVVADDDARVRQVFEKVLGQTGIHVHTYTNGAEAFFAIQDTPPDLIITDILMPRMDGWELGKRIKRNYALRHIPVIILSWKEDFLQRVRKLNVGADDFMLKDLDHAQIVERVARMLRPRFAFERRLIAGGEVSGRIEQLNVLVILHSVMRLKPNCQIVFHDNWNDFEVDISGGELVAVIRTGTDGTFSSSMPALERLLGVEEGRFEVLPPAKKIRRQFPEGAPNPINEATIRMNDMVDQVVDGGLANISKMVLNEEVVERYADVLPSKQKQALEQIRRGKNPREVVAAAIISSEAIETLVLDMVRTGAVDDIESLSLDSEDFLVTSRDVQQVEDEDFELISGGDRPSESAAAGQSSEEPENSQADKPFPKPPAPTAPLPTVPPTEQKAEAAVSDQAPKPPARDLPAAKPGEDAAKSGNPPAKRGKFGFWSGFALFAVLSFLVIGYVHFFAAPSVGIEVTAEALSSGAAPGRVVLGAYKPEPRAPRAEKPDAGPDEKPRAEDAGSKGDAAALEAVPDVPAAAPVQPPGTLVVEKAEDDTKGPIRVSLDKKVVGKTPLRMALPPGKHDLVFSRDGERKYHRVVIESNQETRVTTALP